MLPSMTSSPTRTTRPPRTSGSTVTCELDRAAVEPAERVGQPASAAAVESGTAVVTWATDWSRRRWPTRRAARRRSRRAPTRGPVSRRVRSSCVGDRADLPPTQPVEQRRLALGRRPRGRSGSARARGRRRRSGRSGRARPRRRPARRGASAASSAASVARVIGASTRSTGGDQRCRADRPRRGRARVGDTLPPNSRAATPAGPLVGDAAVGQRPAQRRAAGRAAARRRTARRPSSSSAGPAATCARATAVLQRSRPSAARLEPPSARAPPSAVARPSPSSSARNRSTVRAGAASSARDSPTTRPARSTASVADLARAARDDLLARSAASCSSPRATIGRLRLRPGRASSSRICCPSALRLVADLRRLGAGLGQLRAVLLQSACGLGLHGLGPLDAALDRLAAGREDLLEARRDELGEHDQKTTTNATSPMMISPSRAGSERVRRLRAASRMVRCRVSRGLVRSTSVRVRSDQVPKTKGTTKPISASASESAKPRKA